MKYNLLFTTALVAISFASSDAFSAASGIYDPIVENKPNIGTVTYENLVAQSNWDATVLLVNKGTVNIGENSVFRNNKGGVGGAIAVTTNMASLLQVGSGTVFENNSSLYDGGAIGNYGGTVISDNVTFSNNIAQTDAINDSSQIGGGAISLGSVANITITNSTFNANKSGFDGGAIGTRYGANKNDNTKGQFSISGSTFTANEANGYTKDDSLFGGNGGAIANTFYNKAEVINSNFVGNIAEANGGAIYNDGSTDVKGKGGIMSLANNTYTNNTANIGGAIFNSGEINFSGTNTFSGNKANSQLNDIHNVGTINVAGTMELDGGISGDGSMVLANGSVLKVKTGTTTISNNVTNQGATLNLVFENGYTGGEYKLITGSLDKEFATLDYNNLYNVEYGNANGTYNISKKSTDEIASSTGATQNQASAINALSNGNSANEAFNSVANNVTELLQSSNSADVKKALEALDALSPETAPVVHQSQTNMVSQVFNAVSSRLTSGLNTPTANTGVSSGDGMLEGSAVWAKGIYSKAKLEDDTTHSRPGFTSESTGVALGIEKNVNENIKIGAGYAYTDTSIDAFKRDTDVETHTAFIYGEYKPSNWFINTTVSYNWSKYDEHKYSISEITGKYDVDSYAMQIMSGYEMNIKGLDFTPQAGIRYIHVEQEKYADSIGTEVAENKSDIFTAVFGAKVSKSFATDNGYVLRPEVKAAVTYDIARDTGGSYVTLANGSSYQVSGKALKRFGMEIGFGVTAEISDNVELSIGYEGNFRQSYYENTGLISAKYNF